jgi:hypothetical protein
MKRKYNVNWVFLGVFVIVALFAGCGGDDDDDNDDDSTVDDDDDTSTDDDDSVDDDDDATPDDDDDDDDDNDDDTGPPINPNAKADAFNLFYRERSARTALAVNRFTMSGDAVAANNFELMEVARDGDEYQVVAGPEGNNKFGYSAFTSWKLYQAIGGRNLELTLIRMFEGIVFNEAVTGHSGLTTREAFPGWTRTMDGINGTITRTKWGTPISGPVIYPTALEQEILDTFYDGVTFTYRENPEEFLFNYKAISELTTFALTYVFEALDFAPPFMRVSDCCSSFMVPQIGDWQQGYWGNHNSRDNFTDYAMGFITAFEAEIDPDAPADVRAAAANAAEAARRIGDNIIANDSRLMTVDEWHDYNTLTVAGNMNPDGEVEWQDLGSIAACQSVYLAKAISTDGLDVPVPELPMPGAVETDAIKKLFHDLGLPEPLLPVMTCKRIDDAFIGIGWGEILNFEIFGIKWHVWGELVANFAPDLFPSLFGSMMDDLQELVLGAVGLCYYAQVTDKPELFEEAKQTMSNLVELQIVAARLVYGTTKDPWSRAMAENAYGVEAVARTIKSTDEAVYRSAIWAYMFGIEWPFEDFQEFTLGNERTDFIESMNDIPDTQTWPLMTDQEIYDTVEARLTATLSRAPWRVDRYRARFDHDPPIRRAGNGYEALGPDDQWHPTENPRHLHFQEHRLWHEAPLCVMAPGVLNCEWAAIGCAPGDLNNDEIVDNDDLILFNDAWAQYGDDTDCTSGNGWCGGADFNRNGHLDESDQGYIHAARGCEM